MSEPCLREFTASSLTSADFPLPIGPIRTTADGLGNPPPVIWSSMAMPVGISASCRWSARSRSLREGASKLSLMKHMADEACNSTGQSRIYHAILHRPTPRTLSRVEASSFYLPGRFSRVPESLERKMIVLGGSASIDLAGKVAKTLNAKHGELEIKRFPDGEKYVRILDDVKDQNVVAVQSLYRNPDEYIMELLLLVDALRDLGASSITGVVPYLAYARQDARFKPGEAVSSLTIAKLFETVGMTSFMTVDTHLHRLEDVSKVFHIPAHNLSAMPLLGK